MHADVAGAGHAYVAAFDGDGRAALGSEAEGFAGGQFDFGVGADDLQLVSALQLELIVLGLQFEFAFGADQGQGVGGGFG